MRSESEPAGIQTISDTSLNPLKAERLSSQTRGRFINSCREVDPVITGKLQAD